MRGVEEKMPRAEEKMRVPEGKTCISEGKTCVFRGKLDVWAIARTTSDCSLWRVCALVRDGSPGSARRDKTDTISRR